MNGASGGAYLVISNWLKQAIDNDPVSSLDPNKSEIIPLISSSTQSNSLIGFCVSCDPLLGHILTYRYSTISEGRVCSSMGGLNLSVHVKLRDLNSTPNVQFENKLSDEGVSESKSNSCLYDFRVRGQDMSIEKALVAVKEAVKNIPKPKSDNAADMV